MSVVQSEITPARIERRLLQLSKEIDSAQDTLIQVESEYYRVKTEFEINMAKSRLQMAKNDQARVTVQTRDDLALLDNEELAFQLSTLEAKTKAAKGNVQRIHTQVSIAQSLGASIRTSMSV